MNSGRYVSSVAAIPTPETPTASNVSGNQQQADAKKQREKHHRKNVVLAHRGDQVARYDADDGVHARRSLARFLDDPGCALRRIADHRARRHRIDACARLQQVDHGEADGHANARHDNRIGQRLEAHRL